MPTKSSRAQSWVSCVPQRLAAAKQANPTTTTARASKCRSSQIEIGTRTNIGIAQQRAIDRLARCAQTDHQAHQGRDHDALPVQPLPAEMVDIEADQRRRRIQREADAD